MFGVPMFREVDEDPFFRMHRERMNQMNQMNHMMMDPFAAMAMAPAPPAAITAGNQRDRDYERRGQRTRARQEVAPFGNTAMYGGGDIFTSMNQMMGNMNRMMGSMHQQMSVPHPQLSQQMSVPHPQLSQPVFQNGAQHDPNSQFFSQSTVMTYSNDGSGQPKVYQASTSTKQAPGGVRETKRSVRDSQTGVEKLAIGRQIGDRSHVVTKQKSMRSGDVEENHEYNNLDEDEATAFHSEFMQRANQPGSRQRSLNHHHHPQRRQHTPAIQQAREKH